VAEPARALTVEVDPRLDADVHNTSVPPSATQVASWLPRPIPCPVRWRRYSAPASSLRTLWRTGPPALGGSILRTRKVIGSMKLHRAGPDATDSFFSGVRGGVTSVATSTETERSSASPGQQRPCVRGPGPAPCRAR
jgi:hypothetical protein